MTKTPTKPIIEFYYSLYSKKFGVAPKINGKICGKMIKDLYKDHSEKGIMRIIELFFEDPVNEKKSYHLPSILSSWSVNKYVPQLKYDPNIYSNADELNEEIY